MDKSFTSPPSSIPSPSRLSPQSWDPRDDALLVHLKEVENMGWKQISSYFKNRTSNACQFRWRRLKSGKLKTYNSHRVIKLDPEYLNQVRNHRTGSMLVDDLKMRRNKLKKSIIRPVPEKRSADHHGVVASSSSIPSIWTKEEDQLVIDRIPRNLSFDELCILLPSKTNFQIRDRIQQLEKRRLSIASLTGQTERWSMTDSAGSGSTRSTSLASLTSLSLANLSISSSPTTSVPSASS
ncbi:DEKNAAC104262, partial [Brettanomyces naardenensis]